MTADVALGIVALLCALVLFGRPVIARQRRGEPIGRYAAIWAGILCVAFALALFVGGRR